MTDIFNIEIEDSNIAFKSAGKVVFHVPKERLADFLYLIEVVLKDKDGACLPEECGSHDTFFLTQGAMGKVVPSARLAFEEMKSLFMRKRTVCDELLEGWRMEAADVPYQALAEELDDFALIPIFSYAAPAYPPSRVPAEGRENYGDLLIRFKMAAEGKCAAPSVQNPQIYDEGDLHQYEALVSKNAVGEIEDREAYRIIHFKPEYDHTGPGGNKTSITVKTPLTVKELIFRFGREDLRRVPHHLHDLRAPET